MTKKEIEARIDKWYGPLPGLLMWQGFPVHKLSKRRLIKLLSCLCLRKEFKEE